MNKFKVIGCLLLFLLSLSPTYLSAEIYKWVDENGRTHYSDRKSKQQTVQVVPIKVNSFNKVTYDDVPVDKKSDQSSLSGHKKVLMYSASWCGYCAKARKYFAQHQIAFTEYDIEKNQKARKAYDALGAKGVPVILVGSKRMNGFSVSGFEQIYR